VAVSTGRRLIAGIALALLSGALAAAATPYHDVPVMWLAFVPAIVAQHRVLPPRLSGLGLGIAIGAYYQSYLGPGILADDTVGWYFSVVGVWIGIIATLLTSRSRSFHLRTGYRWFVVLPPLAWVALDFLRSSGPDVFAATFGFPAYSLAEHPALLQPISVTGIYALNLLLLAANWAIARVVITWLDQRGVTRASNATMRWRPAAISAAAVALAAAVWVVASVAMLADPEPTLRVAAVQPGRADSPIELERAMAQTRDAAAHGAELVVWREHGVPFDPRAPAFATAFRDLAMSTGAHVAIGWGHRDDQGRRLNEATVLSPDGRFLGSYGKNHPGTFAGDHSDHRGDFLVYDTAIGAVATIICYDLDFTDTARTMAQRGARIIAVPSNDNEGLAELHYTHLVFRAIENRLTMIKADRAWDSAIIDPYGRILRRQVSPDGSQATLIADVPIGSGSSPWVRFGNWFGWLTVASTVLILVFGRRRQLATDREA
jgi:apolipoprotein N-acyltransferase